MQGITFLIVGAFTVFRPMAAVHAAIGPGIYFAEGANRHKKRIAAKFKMVKRIGNQLFLFRDGVLLPFTL